MTYQKSTSYVAHRLNPTLGKRINCITGAEMIDNKIAVFHAMA